MQFTSISHMKENCDGRCCLSLWMWNTQFMVGYAHHVIKLNAKWVRHHDRMLSVIDNTAACIHIHSIYAFAIPQFPIQDGEHGCHYNISI